MCVSVLALTYISEKDIIRVILLELGSKNGKTVQKVGGGREGRLDEGGERRREGDTRTASGWRSVAGSETEDHPERPSSSGPEQYR